MTFPSYEYGEETGSPISLLRFESAALDAPILWTDVAFPVVRGGETYTPVPVKVGSISAGDALDKAQLEIDVPTDSEVPMLFRYYPLGGTLRLTVLYGHDGDPAGEFVVVWTGRVVGVSHRDAEGVASLDCQPISTAMQRAGLRRNYQRMCQHTLYGPKCKVDREAHTLAMVIRKAEGGKVYVDEMADFNLLKGGIAQWLRQVPGQISVRDSRMITDVRLHNGLLEVTTLSPVIGAVVGDQIVLQHGCNHSLEICSGVFHNAPNYGGMPWIPLDNPTAGTNIY